MAVRRFSLTLEEKEAEIISAWGAAKGKNTMTEIFRFTTEQSMNRSKVQDLYEQLIECRIEQSRNRRNRRLEPDAHRDTAK